MAVTITKVTDLTPCVTCHHNAEEHFTFNHDDPDRGMGYNSCGECECEQFIPRQPVVKNEGLLVEIGGRSKP